MKRSRRFSIPRHYLACAVLGIIGLTLAVQSLVAGPVTGGSSGPSTKLTVYQGTMAITPGRGSSDTLEIGNPGAQGVEIASTGKIFFRPSGKTFDRSIWFDGTSGKTDLYVTGKLYINGAAVPPWPSGSGVSYWSQGANVLSPLPQGSTARGVRLIQPIGTDIWVNKTGFEVVGNSVSPALVVSNIGGPAINVAGNAFWNGNLTVTSANATPLTVNGSKIWYPGNDGSGTGLDADFIDGRSEYFSFTNSTTEISNTSSSLDGSSPGRCSANNAYCLCNNTTDTGAKRGCIELYPSL